MLNAYKEILKPCTNPPSSQFTPHPQSSISHDFDPLNPRKPPKSSISQQLQRLEDPICVPQKSEKKPIWDVHKEEEEEEEKDDDEGIKQELYGVEKPRSNFVQFDQTGPFEPLILSPDGEFPVVQVIALYHL